MKIRTGYITNSSSTNFMIISKQELTPDFLYKKLGFKEDSLIKEQAMELCCDIVDGTRNGLRWFDFEETNEENIKDAFGYKAAQIYKKNNKKGFFTYVGHTGTDSETLTCFFTLDSFEIDEKDFYLNARNCVY